MERRKGSETHPRYVGKMINMKTRDVHRNEGFPCCKTIAFEGADVEFGAEHRQNRSHIGKTVAEHTSGNYDDLTNEQERRKSEPRAAEKRPKSTERHSGDA